ncbi:MAG: late competence development ComFB family protein [Clostridiales bacterium]|nr:late competence development ComFB family protein [Clostridiales bacterium]
MDHTNIKIGCVNIMETLVANEINGCINNLGICTCDICRNDLMALTLNALPPKYVNTEKGAALSKAKQLCFDFQAQIITEITAASEIIKKSPRH